MPARDLVRWIEIEQSQGGGARLAGVSVGRQHTFEREGQPVVKQLALRQQPGLEGRVEVVEPGKQSVSDALVIEQPRMHRALRDGREYVVDIAGAPVTDERQRLLVDPESGKPRLSKASLMSCTACRNDARACSSSLSLHNRPTSRSRVSCALSESAR